MCLSIKKAGDSMAAGSVGQILLNLVVNRNDFDRQMQGIQGIAKKAGVALAGAFAVSKLANFGAKCVELGSDLQEVQNVVDVTFRNMSTQVNEFARQAASSFGLSETMAKKFTGTFGAMAKAFGFNEQAAYEMSTALTGLSGDVASFYNISQDEAYTKLKSVFTGETESLKDLGIVITQTALDAYALANGYGKTTAKMSEAEKVALRYKFVQQQLTTASGDFIRTSDGWANQVRVLKLQFESFKATIGQGLINVLTPVIKVINTIVGKLITLANAFKSFTDMITGNKSSGNNQAATNMQEVADAAEDAQSSTGAIGDAAAKSAKKIKGALSGIDELNVLSTSNSGADSSGGSSGTGGYSADNIDFGTMDTSPLDEVENQTNAIFDKFQELAELFKVGFFDGLGDTKVFDSMKTSAISIKDSLLDVFTDSDVLSAANDYVESLMTYWGKSAGSALSVGASIADNLLGGIAGYLDNSSDSIKEYLVKMFDISGREKEITGNLFVAIGTVFESLRSDSAKQITENFIGILADTIMGANVLFGNLGVDLWDTLTAPFIQNSAQIKESLENTFSAVSPVFADIREIVNECFTVLQSTYDEHIRPMLMSFKDGFVELGEKALELYDTYIVPALGGISTKFGELKDQYIIPLITKFGEFAGKVADAVTAIWDNALKPFVDEFMTTWYPVIADAIKGIGDFFADVGAAISVTLSGVMDALGGLMDFITGVFTGDWSLAWEGIKEFFGGVWDAMIGVVDEIIKAIYNVIRNVLTTISNFISNKLNGIKQTFTEKFNYIKSFVSNIFTNIKNFISKAITGVATGISTVLNRIKSGWIAAWTGMKTVVINIFNGIWSSIKRVINSILGGVESMANGIVRGLNKAIEALNRISFSVPDWVPEIGGMSFGFDVPMIPELHIPKLAQGGYVKANTPQLAMIGDNRHQGEVVAPEDKLQEMASSAVRAVLQASENKNAEKLEKIITIMLQLLDVMANGSSIELDGRMLGKSIQRLNREYYKATGKPLLEL